MGVVESMSSKVRLNSLNKILLNKNSSKFYNQNGNYDQTSLIRNEYSKRKKVKAAKDEPQSHKLVNNQNLKIIIKNFIHLFNNPPISLLVPFLVVISIQISLYPHKKSFANSIQFKIKSNPIICNLSPIKEVYTIIFSSFPHPQSFPFCLQSWCAGL